jgi:hypothetical protein
MIGGIAKLENQGMIIPSLIFREAAFKTPLVGNEILNPLGNRRGIRPQK